jgi:superfamily II DNA or RNA helicase
VVYIPCQLWKSWIQAKVNDMNEAHPTGKMLVITHSKDEARILGTQLSTPVLMSETSLDLKNRMAQDFQCETLTLLIGTSVLGTRIDFVGVTEVVMINGTYELTTLNQQAG